jgi:hypothetical protein
MKALSAASVAVSALLFAGCGGIKDNATEYGGSDGKQVADLINDFDDLKSDAKRMETAFAAGALPKPADQKKYISLAFKLVGKPAVNGATATATVAVEKSTTGDKVGEKQWEFVKEGDIWKIKSAPLP